jgi:ubiquinone/menaquinone biosynthesis C-methylase UbiE
MSTTDTRFSGNIPAIYDQYLVPLIFDFYARDIAARVAGRQPRDVLETAAGTGVVTRAMREILPASVTIVATDLNPAMLDEAHKHAPDAATYRQANAQELPFDDASFDVVVCEFGVMFFPDRVRAFREARRVLRPGGAFLFNVWEGLDTNPIAALVDRAVAERFPEAPPRFLARAPYGQHDHDGYRRALAEAGFGAVSLEVLDGVSRAGSARDAAMAFCAGSPLRGEIEALGPAALDQAIDAATARIEAELGPGPVEAPMQAFVVTAMRN